MNEMVAEWPGAAAPEGRMTEQDAGRFRQLLARLEGSLAADRAAARVADQAAGRAATAGPDA
ncbi:hypothetical protein P3T27_004308 [Kitasatospora sp. MAA19]|uniref:hypothetical protein n=1 Tax=unclassified Kitasatospora TaxID=2633591 RepID=UPI002474BA55|nr:hypothetical protein [Kitasatospora sp. MAA19]MDH6707571.1 hypothetical protein [Kitasatospora sp. MAA19]